MSGLTKGKGTKERSARPYRKVDENARIIFLHVYSRTGNKSKACRQAGVSVGAINAYIKRNPYFAKKVNDAANNLADSLEEALIERGRDGYQEEVYQEGRLVGHKTKYSDKHLLAGLAAMRPARYGNRKTVEVTGAQGGPIQMAALQPDKTLDLGLVGTAKDTELNIFSSVLPGEDVTIVSEQ